MYQIQIQLNTKNECKSDGEMWEEYHRRLRETTRIRKTWIDLILLDRNSKNEKIRRQITSMGTNW